MLSSGSPEGGFSPALPGKPFIAQTSMNFARWVRESPAPAIAPIRLRAASAEDRARLAETPEISPADNGLSSPESFPPAPVAFLHSVLQRQTGQTGSDGHTSTTD